MGTRSECGCCGGDDDLCPHGWPYEFCGICHEEDEAGESGAPCTCTIACIPQGITDEQTCRLRLS